MEKIFFPCFLNPIPNGSKETYKVMRFLGMGKRKKWVVVEKSILGRQLVKKVIIEVGINPFVGASREVQTQSCHIPRQE